MKYIALILISVVIAFGQTTQVNPEERTYAPSTATTATVPIQDHGSLQIRGTTWDIEAQSSYEDWVVIDATSLTVMKGGKVLWRLEMDKKGDPVLEYLADALAMITSKGKYASWREYAKAMNVKWSQK